MLFNIGQDCWKANSLRYFNAQSLCCIGFRFFLYTYTVPRNETTEHFCIIFFTEILEIEIEQQAPGFFYIPIRIFQISWKKAL